jgi:carotenoid cleavage dioxygenase-like enzyme
MGTLHSSPQTTQKTQPNFKSNTTDNKPTQNISSSSNIGGSSSSSSSSDFFSSNSQSIGSPYHDWRKFAFSSFPLTQQGNSFQDITVLFGNIPSSLLQSNSSLLRVGPGLFYGDKMHAVDGDGLITKIDFHKASNAAAATTTRTEITVTATQKFVETKGFLQDFKLQDFPSQKGACGTWTQDRSLRKNIPLIGMLTGSLASIQFKNVANTNILWWENKLLALWEGGKPTSIDPVTLKTMGEEDFGGNIKNDEGFCAHTKILVEGNNNNPRRLIAIGTNPRKSGILPFMSPQIMVWDFLEFGTRCRRVIQLPVKMPLLLHDFAITKSKIIILVGAIDFSPLAFLMGKGFQDFMVKPSPSTGTSKILTISRDDIVNNTINPSTIQVIDLQDTTFCYHFGGAWDIPDGFVLHAVTFPQIYRIDPSTMPEDVLHPSTQSHVETFIVKQGKIVKRQRIVQDSVVDFPVRCNQDNHGEKFNEMVCVELHAPNSGVNETFKSLIRMNGLIDFCNEKSTPVEIQRWIAPPGMWVFEASIAGLQDDLVIAPVMIDDNNSNTGTAPYLSGIVILQKQGMKLLCTLGMKTPLPFVIHGCWVEEKMVTNNANNNHHDNNNNNGVIAKF